MTSRVLIVIVAMGLATACGGTGGATPDVAGDPERGTEIFVANCSECHGVAAQGTDSGPPLVDPVYRPGHHADRAFLIAVRRGVPQHHWRFGSMPAQPGLSDQDVRDVTAFVRALQRAAGID